MHPSKQHFLFLLLLTFIVRSQVLNPIGNCLGNCIDCGSSDLSTCKGTLPCEWGYYINNPNGTCILAPSKEVVWAQLGQRSPKNAPPVSESWGDSTKQIACEYNSASGKKYIDALGLFTGVTMVEKTFAVNSNSDLFELSFNLLRDEWMPFNDFLLIDIQSKDEAVESIEISYEKRIKVESQPTAILCGNKRVISQKFNVKIQNNNNIGNTLTIVFTSFLYTSQWGLTNIKLLSACTHFSSFDAKTQQCTNCDTDSYLATLQNNEKVCDKCPSLCRACKSKTNCTSCLDGATLDKNGSCSFGSNFKTQQLSSTSQLSTCTNYSFYMTSSLRKITFSDIRNENSQLYDQIQLKFKLYYNPQEWMTSSADKISIKINKIEVFILTNKNLTNKGTIPCKSFKSNYAAVIQILTPKKIHNDNSLSLEFEYAGKNKQINFGVSDVSIKSIKKEVVPVEIPKPIFENRIIGMDQPKNATANSSNSTAAASNSQKLVETANKSNTITNTFPLPPNQSTPANATNTSPTNASTIITPIGANASSDSNSSSSNLAAFVNTTDLKGNAVLTNDFNQTSTHPDINSTSKIDNSTIEIIQPQNRTNISNAISIANPDNATNTISPFLTNSTNSSPTVTVNVEIPESSDIDQTKKVSQKPIEAEVTKVDNFTSKQGIVPIIENTTNLPSLPASNSTNIQLTVPSQNVTKTTDSTLFSENATSIIQPASPSTHITNESEITQIVLPQILPPIIQIEESQIDPPGTNQHVPASSSVAYIPTSNNQQSGLHVVISQIPSIANCSLQVSIDKLDESLYSITDTYLQDNDLHLFVAINSSFIGGTMTVYKVASSRLLQASSSSTQKSILAVVGIDRFDSLSSSQLFSISIFSLVFDVFAWFGVIAIIVAVLCGYGVVIEEYLMSLQLLFLHVYIAADYLPLTFRDVIGGLRSIQNLNFLIPAHGEQIQRSWLGNVIQNGPIQFFLFNTDINFTRQFYPIIIINIAYALWFMGLYLSKRFLLRQDLIDQEKPIFYRLIENIICRPINYIDQIWRYQFLATVWCCFIQFYNLGYPEGSNRSQIINALLCILAFICSLGWPVFLGYYCRKYYYENEYSDYLYRFEDIYYRRIPEYFLPSNHHRVGFPIVRTAKLFLAAIFIAYLGSIASLTLLLLAGLQLFEAGYAKYHEIFSDHKYLAHRLIENVLFALIELILFFLCNFSSLALTESYVYIGFILSGMALAIVLNSVARAAHLAYYKYREMYEEIDWEFGEDAKPKTQRIV